MTILGFHESRNYAQSAAPVNPASADDCTAARTASSRPLKLAYVLAVANAVVIGVSFLLVKLTLAYADPIGTLTYRFAAALIIIGVPAAFAGNTDILLSASKAIITNIAVKP